MQQPDLAMLANPSDSGLDTLSVEMGRSVNPSRGASVWIQRSAVQMPVVPPVGMFEVDASGLYFIARPAATDVASLVGELSNWHQVALEAFHLFEDSLPNGE